MLDSSININQIVNLSDDVFDECAEFYIDASKDFYPKHISDEYYLLLLSEDFKYLERKAQAYIL